MADENGETWGSWLRKRTWKDLPGLEWAAETVGLDDTDEEEQLKRELEADKAKLREQAKTGITPELRKFARQAAQARAALGSRFSDRRLSPEQRARMLGGAQASLSGKTAAGGAELMRSGREIAEQNLRAINEKRRAEINAQQQQMMNAALNVASMGAGLMAGPAAGAATNALTQNAQPLGSAAPSAPVISVPAPIDSMYNRYGGGPQQNNSSHVQWDWSTPTGMGLRD